MRLTLRSTIGLALACIFYSPKAGAQQLHQPTSVLPWVSFAAQVAPSGTQGTVPTPQLHTVSQKAPSKQQLPMVEMESFALLGQIGADNINRSRAKLSPKATAIDTPSSLPPLLRLFRANRNQTASQTARR